MTAPAATWSDGATTQRDGPSGALCGVLRAARGAPVWQSTTGADSSQAASVGSCRGAPGLVLARVSGARLPRRAAPRRGAPPPRRGARARGRGARGAPPPSSARAGASPAARVERVERGGAPVPLSRAPAPVVEGSARDGAPPPSRGGAPGRASSAGATASGSSAARGAPVPLSTARPRRWFPLDGSGRGGAPPPSRGGAPVERSSGGYCSTGASGSYPSGASA